MKICLYGAFGRHNFGDLLFPHIIISLLNKYNSNINMDNIVLCDLFERDMTIYGGHLVKSITILFDKEISHMILVGGQVCSCDLSFGIKMIDPDKNEINNGIIQELKNRLESGCYILDKNIFSNKSSIFIANSIGGLYTYNDNIKKRLDNYNYVSTRDSLYRGKHNISPDCAILTKELFDDKIRLYKDQIPNDKYIAIQCNERSIDNNLIKNIKQISDYLKLPIYLFVAGIAPNHDSFEKYKNIIDSIKTQYGIYIFEETNIWKICCLIANSYITIGTSLHVRIIAFVYSRIRYTICLNLDLTSKHHLFLCKWDNINNSYITNDQLFDSIKRLDIDKMNSYSDDKSLNLAINEYRSNSKQWLKYFD